MNNYFEIKNQPFGVMISYQRGEEVIDNDGVTVERSAAWKEQFNAKLDELTSKNESLVRDDLELIYEENTTLFVTTNLKKAIENLKDLNNNSVDFSALSPKHQEDIIKFLQKPLEDVLAFGALANLSDIKLEINGDDLYIEANIHTIDNKILSSAALFTPRENVDYKKFLLPDDAYFTDIISNNDFRFYFASENALNTNERKAFINELKNVAHTDDLKEFKNAYIQVGYADNFANSINNLEFDFNEAIKNIDMIKKERELAKNFNEKEQNAVFLSLFLDKLRINFQNYKELTHNESEKELIENFAKEPLKEVLKDLK